jgi:hypothetical protein
MESSTSRTPGEKPGRADASRGYRPTGASLAAIILAAISFTAAMALHILRGNVDPVRRVLSEYANGSNGPVMTLVFYAFGLAAIALGFRLSRGLDRRVISRAIPWLFGLAGVSLIAAGVFEVERPLVPDTLEEVIHSYASMAAFVMEITGLLLFSFLTQDDPRWRRFRWTSFSLASVAAVTAVASPFTADTGWSGAVQRVLGLSVLMWFLLTALHIRRKAYRQIA